MYLLLIVIPLDHPVQVQKELKAKHVRVLGNNFVLLQSYVFFLNDNFNFVNYFYQVIYVFVTCCNFSSQSETSKKSKVEESETGKLARRNKEKAQESSPPSKKRKGKESEEEKLVRTQRLKAQQAIR